MPDQKIDAISLKQYPHIRFTANELLSDILHGKMKQLALTLPPTAGRIQRMIDFSYHKSEPYIRARIPQFADNHRMQWSLLMLQPLTQPLH
ncbi:hypothetical protein D3C76_1037190 [compost metagenome]